jgi:hypothetical protein
METMPFTLAHAAAALPFRRLRLVPSAVVVGTMAPDFEYFLRFAPQGGFGHTVAGAFLLSLPLALLVLWVFHILVKAPLIQLFPDAIRLRLCAHKMRFRFGGPGRFLLIAVSALTGIATHIVWDSFTHRYMWPSRHWALLRAAIHLPVLGAVPLYKVLQHTSTVAGILILCAWVMRWYVRTEPECDPGSPALPPSKRWFIVGCICLGAIAGGLIRSAIAIWLSGFDHDRERTVGVGVVTGIALAWWLLVAYAVLVRVRQPSEVRV